MEFSIGQCIARRERQLDALYEALEHTMRCMYQVKRSSSLYASDTIAHMQQRHLQWLQDQLQAQQQRQVLKCFSTALPIESAEEIVRRLLELREQERTKCAQTTMQWPCLQNQIAGNKAHGCVLEACHALWLQLVPNTSESYLDPWIHRFQLIHDTEKQRNAAQSPQSSPYCVPTKPHFPAKCCFASAPSPIRSCVFNHRFTWSNVPPNANVDNASASPDRVSLPLRHLQSSS